PHREQAGQYPSRHAERSNEPGDREYAKLGEPGEAGEQHGAEAEDRGRRAKKKSRRDTPNRLFCRDVRFGLSEEIDGIVNCLTDKGNAETECDAVHKAEP